jgi:glutamine synthetase type III
MKDCVTVMGGEDKEVRVYKDFGLFNAYRLELRKTFEVKIPSAESALHIEQMTMHFLSEGYILKAVIKNIDHEKKIHYRTLLVR